MALAAIRQSLYAALTGLSPFKALYGPKPCMPLDINLTMQPSASVSAHEYNRELQ